MILKKKAKPKKKNIRNCPYIRLRCEMLKKLRQERYEKGLCTGCGQPHDTHKSMCPKCLAIINVKARLRTAEKHRPIRKLRKWTVTNQELYDCLIEKKMSIKQLSNIIGVSTQTINVWLFKGYKPCFENQLKLEEIFSRPFKFD